MLCRRRHSRKLGSFWQESLTEINFNAKQDILVSVGDIIDRHEDSLKVALWMLNQPNIHVACGNHEKYFLIIFSSLKRGITTNRLAQEDGGLISTPQRPARSPASNMQNQLALSITVEYAKAHWHFTCSLPMIGMW